MAITSKGKWRHIWISPDNFNKDATYHYGNKTIYYYDYRFRNEDPSKLVKWLRKNFGERGMGWDFTISNGCVIVEIVDQKYKTMYNLWIL